MRKSITKKRVRRGSKKSRKSDNVLLKYIWSMVFFIAIAGVGVFSYYLGFENALESEQKLAKESAIEQKQISLRKSLQKLLNEESDKYDKLSPKLPKKPEIQEKIERKKPEQSAPKIEKEVVLQKPKKSVIPKLAIIFDDVATAHHVKAVKSIGFPSTLSFFPDSPYYRTKKLAAKESFYIIHLPLEASKYIDNSQKFLKVTDSEWRMEQEILRIKRDFPNIKYMNNHTGSKFTANKEAVRKLIKLFKKHGLIFIDSRTTKDTKVKEVAEQMGESYMSRNIFLDHESGIEYIKGQFKKAIIKAKKDGFAIAIGHPRSNTITALKEAKGYIDGVELVRIDEL